MEKLGRWMRGGAENEPLIEHPEEALPEPLKQES